ncbi:hypothetical protein [Conexibacter sp. CPCC 206217]|uniref:hypothetical protein n=1 Tax=Conexibacter sp. CPCC 206217 TaxID=3064574 RepID=UPI00271F59D3|nr:hypothetical protein [Conexibacter sp. CPCC 206217]MDO8209293.1 hypothetical protein [Conexibacter sp. CPCC 206217]
MSDKSDWMPETLAEVISRLTARATRAAQRQAHMQSENGPRTLPDRRRTTKRKRHRPAYDVVRLVSKEDDLVVKAHLDDGYPQSFGGYGGWEDETRPGQTSATVFRGTSAPQLRLRLILGGWPRRRDVDCERDMRVLDHFARLPFDRKEDRPTLLRIRGQVPHHHRRWFVEKLEWGEVDVVRNTRVRAFVTVTLRMYVPVDLLKRRDPIARPTRSYTVKGREDLRRIVKEELGLHATNEITAAARYVRRMNHLKPGDKLKERIKLPRGSWWRREVKRRKTETAKPRAPKVWSGRARR